MRRRQVTVEREADKAASIVDVRNLALELAGLVPQGLLDPMAAGLVLRAGEGGRRLVKLRLQQRTPVSTIT